jgi:hypothetical protein
VRGAPGLADVTGDGVADILFTAGGAIDAYRGSGSPIVGWGRRSGDFAPGTNYYVAPTADDLDGDGRTEVLSGAAVNITTESSDTTLYCYDAGSATFSAAGRAWPTARGNAARTGALGGASLPLLDDVAPATVLDLDVTAATDTSITLAWTAVGNDGLSGTAASYDLRYSTSAMNESNFTSALVAAVGAPQPTGSPETADIHGLASSTHYYFALRVRDPAGNASALSNVADTTTSGASGPLAGITGPALRVAPHPARGQVNFYYRGQASAPGVQNRIEIYDLTGRRIQQLEQGTRVEGSFTWNGKDEAGGLVPAGIYFARLVSGSTSVKTRVVWMP